MFTLGKSALVGAMILTVILLGAGCGGGDQPQTPPAAPAGGEAAGAPGAAGAGGNAKGKGTKPAATAEADAGVLDENIPDWKYDPTSKWDPFLVPPEPVPSNTIHDNYDLDQMLLLGVVHGTESMSAAYIRMPNGKDRIVQIGDILGKHGGEVKQINKDSIMVEEKYMDPQRPNDTFIIEKELRIPKDRKK